MTITAKYKAYLRSKKWKAKRKQALAFYGNKCAVCGSRLKLEVHHITYARLYNEQMVDLRILCHKHHQEITKFHWKIGRRTDGLIAFNMFMKMNRADKPKTAR